MSTKHVFQSPDGLVLRSLRGATALNPNIQLHEPSKTVYVVKPPAEARVALVAGGGAGHEPAHGSYTGKGMLAAAVSGDIFASPSASQILTAVELAVAAGQKERGSLPEMLLVINNYTGDRLNFGLALERARARYPELKIDALVVADDVSLLHTDSLVGPRGLGGNILVCKILGAAAAAGQSLAAVQALGKATVDALASVGVGLSHCHVPGRAVPQTEEAAPEECELGMGLHNEPGARKASFESADQLIGEMLGMLLQSRKNGLVDIAKRPEETDETVLFVNNLGGISQLELGAVVDEAMVQLRAIGIRPRRVYAWSYMTSLNAPGFSLSLLNISRITRLVSSADVYALLDAPTEAPAWSGVHTGWQESLFGEEQEQALLATLRDKRATAGLDQDDRPGVGDGSYWRNADISTVRVESAIRSACKSVLSVADDMTNFDTIVGDGDCGETFAAGANAILRALDDKSLQIENLSPPQLAQLLGELCEGSMGGTAGAILAIFFTALATTLPAHAGDPNASWPSAPSRALQELSAHTPARPGDRTLVDALHPFGATLADTEDIRAAARAAREGAESTRGMRARLGRAAYVEDATSKGLPPDPGAWGVAALVEGLCDGWDGGV
ncbi:Dak1-domain-containing protein [Peniophora sp. CONT]|nr:Dak1-domain-containing protein [Peniophora sp. CONT]